VAGSERRRISILGVAIDDVIEQESVERIAEYIAEGGAHQIVTVNPEFVMEAQRNPIFRGVLAAADLATPDGFGLLLVARMRKTPFRGRVTGVELTERLAAESAKRGWRIFFLGAAPGVAEEASERLAQRYPGMQIAGCYAGSPQIGDELEIRRIVQEAKPDILLVAYGHPAQDLWIARNQPFLQVPVAIGVGGVFDYVAGRVQRAPFLLRKLGLEWLFRLWKQPWRWRRIVTAVPVFLAAALSEPNQRSE
jgi:N-acetylglucosaminyldiphosphoundecaprenol N-acetyl-beta-D-mannosaminyltransferase